MNSTSPRSFLRRHALDGIALLLLAILTALFFWRLWAPLPDDRVVFPRGDFTDQYYPLRHFVARSFSQGQLPFWNPYIFGGQPGLADPQAATFYPPAALNMLAWGANFPLEALQTEVVLHVLAAAWGAYIFMRAGLRLGVGAALVGAVAWAFSGYLTGFALEQVTIIETIAWLPYLLLCTRFAILSPVLAQRGLSSGLGALAGGCAVLAGHPQSLLYLFYLTVAYGLFLALRQPVSRWQKLGRIGGIFAMLGLAVGVAALQLLPTLEFIGESTRETLNYDFVQGGQAWGELLEMVLPKVVGSTPLYLGILPLLLLPTAFFDSTQRAEKVFWAGVALVSLIIGVGGNSFIFDLLYLGAPGWDNIRSQERGLIGWVWAASVLAAYGVASLQRDAGMATLRPYVRRLAWFAPVILLPLIGLWWFRAFEFAQIAVNLEVITAFFNRYTFFVLVFILAILLLVWRGRTTTAPRGLFVALLLTLLIFDLFSITRTPHIGLSADRTLPRENEVVAHLRALDLSQQRVGVVGGPIPQGNDGMTWGLPLLSGNEPLRLRSSAVFFEEAPAGRQFQLLAAQYVVAGDNLAESEPGTYELLTRSTEGAASWLHRLRTDTPYAWFVAQVEAVPGRTSLFERIAAPDFNPYQLALNDRDVPPLATDGAAQAVSATVTVLERRAGYGEMVTNHDANGPLMLVIAEPRSNGWQILIDGAVVAKERVNGINVAVPVPPGEHRVELTYIAPGWQTGLAVTAVSLGMVGLLLVGSLLGLRRNL